MNATEFKKFLKTRIIKDKIQLSIIVCITVYTIIFSYFTILRHYSFDSGAWDLGTYEQMLWNTINSGKLFWTAPDPINPTGFFFGTHFSPILFIILPIYFLHQATETLLVLQSFVIALGALPLYWLARDELKSKIAGVVIALAYLLYAPLHGVNWFDFHTQAFIPLFFNLAFYYFTKKKWIKYLICVIFVLSVNEAMPLMIITMGFYGLWKRRNYITEYFSKKKSTFIDKTALISLSTIVIGFVWFIIARKIISSINPSLPFTMWSEFGTDLPSIIINMVSDPVHTLEVMFSWYAVDKLFYIVGLFLPLLFLSFFDPPSLFIALPWIGMSFLSNINPYITPVGYQYPAHILSIIFVSAIYGVKRLRIIKERIDLSPKFKWTKPLKISNKRLQRIALVLIMVCSVSTFIGLSPLGINLKIGVNGRPFGSSYNDVLRDVIAVIQDNASISTQDNVFPIFARRMNAYPYPSAKADYILVDSRNMWYHIIFPFTHVETNSPHFDELISEVVNDGSFERIVAVDGIYLFKNKDYQGNTSTPVLSEGLKATFRDNSGEIVGETHVLNIVWDWSHFSPFPGNITRQPDSTDSYNITYTGFIILPQNGKYTFILHSDDNSTLTINNLNITNPRAGTYVANKVVEGLYEIEIIYKNEKGD
ncbi:MAG: DUF2079 domain-containing protein, partial [Candidatus Neomarinimicrobiota bacterium]